MNIHFKLNIAINFQRFLRFFVGFVKQKKKQNILFPESWVARSLFVKHPSK